MSGRIELLLVKADFQMSNFLPSRHPWPVIAASLFFAFSMVWMGRNLNFSAYAHPDERNKIIQVVDGEYNFHHPLLMLNLVRIVSKAVGVGGDFESVKLVGRWSSVFFTSAAIALLVLLMGRIYGGAVATVAGVFLLANPHIFDLAHYFKEDPALLFGLSISLLAIKGYSEKPGKWLAALTGLASSCAISGKYAGVVILPFAVYVLCVCSPSRGKNLWPYFSGLLFGMVLINLPAFLALGSASGSLDREIGLLTGHAKPISRSVPHGVYSNVYWQSSTPVLVGLLVLYGWQLFRRKFRLSPVEWVLVSLPLFYIAILSFLPRTNHRYFLPAAAILACLAAAGLLPVLEAKNGRLWAICIVAASLAWQAPRLYCANIGFTQDHRKELVDFIESEIPPGSLLLQDQNIDLPDSIKIPIMKRRIGSRDTLESLRKEGISHVVVAQSKYGQFFKTNVIVSDDAREDFNKTKQFFESLFQEGELLREWKTGDNLYLAAPFRIYSIKKLTN